MAADFLGAEVMCPSCKEALRLPKTPDDVRPHTVSPEKPAASIPPPAVPPVRQPVRAVDRQQDAGPSVLRAMLSTTDGRLKLTLALLLPLTLIVCALLFFPPKEFTPEHIILGDAALLEPPFEALQKPAPPPPPVAVSEMPVPPPPSLPQPGDAPVPEVAVVQPVPEPATPITEIVTQAVTELTESAPLIAEPATTPPAPEPALVEAVPATPAPEPPAPSPTVRPEPEPAAAPAELVHSVVRGDTLGKLARKYQVGIATIKKANGMKSDAVMLGQKLKIPGAIKPPAAPEPPTIAETPAPAPAPAPQAARSYTVARGDTLDRIARKHRVTPQQIMQANGMKNDVVRLGRKLVIPAAP